MKKFKIHRNSPFNDLFASLGMSEVTGVEVVNNKSFISNTNTKPKLSDAHKRILVRNKNQFKRK